MEIVALGTPAAVSSVYYSKTLLAAAGNGNAKIHSHRESYKKKEAAASFFCQMKLNRCYFTMNFMVFSKPLAFTVTK